MKKYHIISMVGREIAGYHTSLHIGFDQLGQDNHFFFERSHDFYKYKKRRIWIEKLITGLNDFIFKSNRSFEMKIIYFGLVYPFVYMLKIALFPYFLMKYNVFIYSTNYSFLGLFLDRWILKLCGKTTIDIVTGSDVRPPYLNGKFLDLDSQKMYYVSLFKKIIVRMKIKPTTHLIDHVTVSHFNNRDYIPYLYVGFPFFIPPQKNVKESSRPLILHAPSDPRVKGTDIIRDSINELKDDHDFDYEELMNVPHATVLEKIQQCHFVINEMYSDTLMSGLDTEAAWFAKPSIVGGYDLKQVEDSVNDYDVAPTYRIKPSKENLKKAIIHLLEDNNYRQELGETAQEFVQENWSSRSVAQKYLDIINGDIPDHIIRSPCNDYDIYGGGIRSNIRKKNIVYMVEKYGMKSLCLDDKPELKNKILQDCDLL